VRIELDHLTVPASDMRASAERLAAILGVHTALAATGPFLAVYVNEGLTVRHAQPVGGGAAP